MLFTLFLSAHATADKHPCKAVESLCEWATSAEIDTLAKCSVSSRISQEKITLFDPLTLGLSKKFEAACVKALQTDGSFTGSQCNEAFSCATPTVDRLSAAETNTQEANLEMRECNHELEFCYECNGEWTFKPCHCYIPVNGPEEEEGDEDYYSGGYSYTPEPYSGEGDPCTTPGNGGLMCDIYDAVCDIVIGIAGKVASKAECVADDAGIAAACETAGVGPEDPLSDICAVTFAAAFQYACSKAISEAGAFTKKACKAAGGCSDAALAFHTHLAAPQFALE